MAGILHRAPVLFLRFGTRLDRIISSTLLLPVVAFLAAGLSASPSLAVTPESPEVRKLIDAGLGFLEKNSDHRLGGKCLIALAFHKNGASADHPRIVEAVKACQGADITSLPDSDYNYSTGLAVILLSELKNPKHHDLIKKFAGAMAQSQKPHGGWGYEINETGDTSQTQYAALCFWELMQVGITPSVNSVDACTNWLLRTQDPSGVWGYQGKDPGSFELVSQKQTSSSMLAAGLGSLMICGNILGIVTPNQRADQLEQEKLPAALRRTAKSGKKMPTLRGTSVSHDRVHEAIKKGQKWYGENYKYAVGLYPCYELYSLERYKSFEEVLTGNSPEEPDWYQKGYKYLLSTQRDDGSWIGRSGKQCSTAFAILFLSRSMKGSLSLGEGTLVGGRGLSADLARMKMKNGRLVKEQKPTGVDKLLAMLEDSGNEELEALMSDSVELQVGKLGPDQARRLQMIVKKGQPKGRLLAVRALGQMRELDQVPTLLYAMTDPDKRVVLAARDELRFVSRRFQGFGLPHEFDDRQRYDALDKWKQWYRRVRPNAPPLP
jgi:hypothetical protein